MEEVIDRMDEAELVIATPCIHECHITVGHILCDIVETRLVV